MTHRTGITVKIISWLVVFLLLLPVLVVVPMSFAGGTTFQFPPQSWSLRWYENLFSDHRWTFAIGNSVKVASATALIATTLGTMAAIGVSRLRPRWRSLSMSVVLMPLIIPNIFVALAIYSTFLALGLNGTLIGLVLAHTAVALPFVFIVVNARLQGLDPRMRDAALNLGATPPQAFRQVVLPLLLPGVMAALVLSFVNSFDEVVIALFLQTPANTTLPIQMYNSVAVEIDPTISAAASIIVVGVSALILAAQLLALRRKERVAR